MNKPDLKLGRELAEKATKGEWQSDQCGDFWTSAETEILNDGMEVYRTLGSTRYAPNDPNAAHIAHHSGKTMLEIYDLINELERDVAMAKNFARVNLMANGELHKTLEEYEIKISSLEAQVKVMEEALKNCAREMEWCLNAKGRIHRGGLFEKVKNEALSRVEEMRRGGK